MRIRFAFPGLLCCERDEMDALPAKRSGAIHFGGHSIRFLRYRSLDKTEYVAAFVMIEPPTLVSEPDIVLGLGVHKSAARRNAFGLAKARIKKSRAKS
jgi:hypothetical protein